MPRTQSTSDEDVRAAVEVHSVAEIAELDERHRRALVLSDHVANLITAFSGSMAYVGIHIIWFGAWIVLNLGFITAFDPFPFSLLTMIVSLEAIFLASFVLISQNKRPSRRTSEQRLTCKLTSSPSVKIRSLSKCFQRYRNTSESQTQGTPRQKRSWRRLTSVSWRML